MNRDELLDLCERYVRARGFLVDTGDATNHSPPVIEIIDGYLHAEISESEKNSLLAFVRGANHDPEEDAPMHDLEGAVLAELDDAEPL